GPVQRDLYSAFLAAHLNLQTFLPSLAQEIWESAETRRLSSRRGHHPTRECGAGLAPKHGYAPCRSASAQKSWPPPARAWPPTWEPGKAGRSPRTSQPLGGRVSGTIPSIVQIQRVLLDPGPIRQARSPAQRNFTRHLRLTHPTPIPATSEGINSGAAP